MRENSDLIRRMALDNPSWGDTRIQGALANVGHRVGRGTVANALKRNGMEPAPERGKRTRWSAFLKAHWRVIAASDFLTVEVWTGTGLVTHHVLFMIRLADPMVKVLGVSARPDERWMPQVGRNLIDCETGSLGSRDHLIIDRDSKYTEPFRRLLKDAGVHVIGLPPLAPNLNAYAERFVHSIKDEPD